MRLSVNNSAYVLVACVAVVAALLSASVDEATAASPAFSVRSIAAPSRFVPGDDNGIADYQIVVKNIGGAPTDGSPITITDNLPHGVKLNPFPSGTAVFQVGGDGARMPPEATCDSLPVPACTVPRVLQPGGALIMTVPIDVDADRAGTIVANQTNVSGGGAPTVSATEQTPVSDDPAGFGFQRLNSSFVDTDGLPVTQAGSHPYQFNTSFLVNTVFGVHPGNPPAANVKDVRATLPVGMVVNPNATAVRCTEAQLETTDPRTGESQCPDASAVGIAHPVVGFLGYTNAGFSVPLYNMVPRAGVAAEFAFNESQGGFGIVVHLEGGLDTAGNYALIADARDIVQFGSVTGIDVDLWGNPTDPSHDYRRGNCVAPFYDGKKACPTAALDTSLLTMPSACSGPLETTIRANSWQNPSEFITGSSQTEDNYGDPVGVTGCQQLDFTPSISIKPDVSVADSPTGLDVDLGVPQTSGVNTLATANLKEAVVTLPAGMSVSPSAADGLLGCSQAQISLHDPGPASCPDGSKIGTVKVVTPLLNDPLEGFVYLAAQNANPSRSVLGLYVTAVGSGVQIKLAGRVHADPATGQLTATFDDNPQLPFSDFTLHFDSGPRAPLATPDGCGTYTASSALSPWSGTPAVTLNSSFPISSGCDGGFAPAFTAGATNPSAGQTTDFTLRVSRADGQQHVKSITTTLPAGILAKVGSVTQCSDADASAGTCDAGSQIGSTDTAAGPGSNPFHVRGRVYLTGPYKGAPYGLSIVVPAIAGPFNLGTVVVRAAIRVDPSDAHVTVVSDDVPNLLDVTGDDGDVNGFPLRVRTINVTMDRPDFVVNPTSCDPTSIAASLESWEGASSPVSSRFQVGGCAALPVAPKLSIALTGRGQTTDDKHPGVHATVSQTPGQANLKKVVVTLPLSLALDPDNAQALCEFTDGSKVDPTCPKGSVVGKATAHTPILNQPLTGPVYFVKNIRKDPKSGREIRTLPKLVIPLTGENGLRLNLTGTSNVVDNHLVTTFDNIPDAPVSDFTLNIDGGKSGILVVSGTDICKSTQVADQQIDGQNGKTADADVYLQTPACPLKILSKKVGKTSVAIKVGGLSAGKVTVTGHGIKKTSKAIAKSTVATITAKRTKGKPGKVTVSFDPAGPAKAHKTTK